MQKLYFIRHGQTYDNVKKLWALPETDLTDQGREQARNAGRFIKKQGIAFDVIISSPLPRAYETACLIAAEIGHPVDKIERHDSFVERAYGALYGLPTENFLDGSRTYKDVDDVAGAETVERMQQRARAALAYLRSRPEPIILVVAHNAFGRAFRRAVLGQPYTDEYRSDMPEPLKNAELIELI